MTELKNSRASTAGSTKQKTVSSKTGHSKLPNQRNKKKEGRKKVYGIPLNKLIYTLWELRSTEKEKGAVSLFKEIMTKNFPNLQRK